MHHQASDDKYINVQCYVHFNNTPICPFILQTMGSKLSRAQGRETNSMSIHIDFL